MRRISTHLAVQRLAPARRVQALERMLAQVPTGHEHLRPHIERAILAQDEAVNLARTFQADRDNAAMHSEQARILDAELDRTLSTTADAIAAMIKVTPQRDPHHEALRDIVEQAFPKGVAAITSQPFVMQHRTVKTMLDALSDEDGWVAPIAELGLARFFDRVAELNAEYGERLTRREGVGYEAVSQAARDAFEPFAEVIARVIGAFPTNSDADLEAREALLAPVADQEAEASQYRRRRRNDGERPDAEAGADDGSAQQDGDPPVA
ncbi:MAG: hypothetical protein AAF602_16425 [Myxococcota bacterium]